MPSVSAFMIPGSPLPFVNGDNPPWGRLAAAMSAVSRSLASSEPDVILLYSTQWFAVLDQLWQTRGRIKGRHVDENWHEYGAIPFDIVTDVELARSCVEAANENSIKSKSVDYDQFPVDTGTIIANHFLNAGMRAPLVITSNNLYHDWETTWKIGEIAAATANSIGKRYAVVSVGGLSGSFFRHDIDISEDRIANEEEHTWNKRILDILESGQVPKLLEVCPEYVAEAKVDMGFKHMSFLLGALGGQFSSATVHAYEPLYGAGGAVVEFTL